MRKVRIGEVILAQTINDMIDQIRMNQITNFSGGKYVRNGGGTALFVSNEGGGGGKKNSAALPFSFSVNVNDSGQTGFQIAGNSYLQNIETGKNIPIAGLGPVIGSPAEPDMTLGLKTMPNIGECVWLTVEVFNLVVTAAYIETGDPQAKGWYNFPCPLQLSGENSETNAQKECRYSRFLLAEVHGPFEDVLGESFEGGILRPCVSTNLGLKLGVINYVVGPIIMPWGAPARITWNNY